MELQKMPNTYYNNYGLGLHNFLYTCKYKYTDLNKGVKLLSHIDIHMHTRAQAHTHTRKHTHTHVHLYINTHKML